MKCSICRKDASYIKSIDKKFVNRLMHYGSELYAARCKNCLDKKEEE